MGSVAGHDLVRAAFQRRELGEGIALVPLAPHHAEQFSALVQANREYLGAWMGWVWEPFPVDAAQAEIERMALREKGPWSMAYAVERDGAMIGFAQLFGIKLFLGTAEVSYWIDQHETGRGVTTRAVRQLCDVAFRQLSLHRVELRCAAENEASRAIARRCGFTEEGTLRGAWRVRDRRQDLVVHSRLATDRVPAV